MWQLKEPTQPTLLCVAGGFDFHLGVGPADDGADRDDDDIEHPVADIVRPGILKVPKMLCYCGDRCLRHYFPF